MEVLNPSLVVCGVCTGNSDGVYVFKGARGLDNLLIAVGSIVLCLMSEIPYTLEYLDREYKNWKGVLCPEAIFAEKLAVGLFTYLAVHQRHYTLTQLKSLRLRNTND